MPKSVCIVTGTRAEYHLLAPLIKRISQDPDLELRLAVTGAHLSAAYGETYRDIEKDGFDIDVKIPLLEDDDTPYAINSAISRAINGFNEYFMHNAPDLLVLLGDRYEILPVAIAAMNYNVPIAHIGGGDTTLGAVDECIRHSLTKMSHIHFTDSEIAKNRVIQLGEDPSRVYNTGSLAAENVKNVKLMSKEELEKSIGFSLGSKFSVVTFHPVTLEKNTAAPQFLELLDALSEFTDLKVLFTKSNADSGGLEINRLIDEYVSCNTKNAFWVFSLGVQKYYSALKYASVVIGNSSSGIFDTPYFKTPTVNIGDRQKGRQRTANIIDCRPNKTAITDALKNALDPEFKKNAINMETPYDAAQASKNIVDLIKEFLFIKGINIKKSFYDII